MPSDPRIFLIARMYSWATARWRRGLSGRAIACAAHHQLSSLIGVLDVNRLGQRGPTMLEHDMATYEARIKSFGWATRVIDGHDIEALADAYTWGE